MENQNCYVCDSHFQPGDYDASQHLLPAAVPHVDGCEKVNEILQNEIKELKYELKKAKSREYYHKKKIASMKDMMEDLKNKNLIDDQIHDILESRFSDLPLEIITNLLKTQNKTKRYSSEVKAFANTIYYYSPKAYKYIQPILNLPHPKYVQSWASSRDAEPGYLEEVINLLKNEVIKDPTKANASLVLDEMSLKSDTPYNSSTKKYEGKVDLGSGVNKESDVLATHALVVMVVGVTSRYKYPIGYFFTSSIAADALSDIITHSLTLLEENGVNVLNVTSDGVRVNWSCMQKLGCQMCITKLKTYFIHPANPSKIVYYVPDVVHMVKLIRNLLSDLAVLKIKGSDKTIEWKFVERVLAIQEQEGLRSGNKINHNHVQWEDHKLKFIYAKQVLSRSMADSIDYCRDDIKLEEFQGSEETSKFIRHVDRVFHRLNSNSPKGHGLNSPITKMNYDEVSYKYSVEKKKAF